MRGQREWEGLLKCLLQREQERQRITEMSEMKITGVDQCNNTFGLSAQK